MILGPEFARVVNELEDDNERDTFTDTYIYISGPHHEQLPRGRKTFTGTYIYLVPITSSCREDVRHSPVRIYIWSPSRAAAERTEDIHRYVYISGLHHEQLPRGRKTFIGTYIYIYGPHHEQLPRGRKTFTGTYIYLVSITSSSREDGRHSPVRIYIWSPSRAAAERTEDINRYVYISGLHHEQLPRGRKTFTGTYIYLVPITSSCREDGRHSPVRIYIWSPSRAAAERTEDIHRYVYISGPHHEQLPRGRKTFTGTYIYLVPITSSCREDGRHSPVRIYIWSPSRAAAERTEDIHRYVYISGLHHEQLPRGRKTFTGTYIYLVSITSSCREDGRHSSVRIYIWSPSRAAAERTEDIHRYVYISGLHHEQLPRGRKTFTGTCIYLVSITSSCREDGRHSPVRVYIWSPSRAAAERTEDIHRYVYISGPHHEQQPRGRKTFTGTYIYIWSPSRAAAERTEGIHRYVYISGPHHEQLPRGRKTFTGTYIYLVPITSSCREDGRHSPVRIYIWSPSQAAAERTEDIHTLS